MKIIEMEAMAAEEIREPALEAMHRANDLFGPLILPFFAILKKEELTWKEELEIAKKYRNRFSDTGCLLWSPEEPGTTSPVRIHDTQELILNMRGMTGTILAQQAADIKKTGTVEKLPGGGLKISGREGIPGGTAGEEEDIVTIDETGEIGGGEEDILSDKEIAILKDAFFSLPNDLKIHWAIDGGLHVVWAEIPERLPEPENTEEKEEEGISEVKTAVEIRDRRGAGIQEVRITATEIYAEFQGDSIPDYVDGLIIPNDLIHSVTRLPERYAILLKIEEEQKEEMDEIFRRISETNITNIDLILPTACNPEELEYTQRLMEKHGLYRSRGFRVMATIAHPCALLIASELADVSDGLYVDMPELLNEMYGGEAIYSVKGAYMLPLKRCISMIQNAVKREGKGGRKRVIYCIPPGADDEISAILVREGVRSVSCSPTDIDRVVDAIAREEHRLLLRNVGLNG